MSLQVAFLLALGLKIFPLLTCLSLVFSENASIPWQEAIVEYPLSSVVGASSITLSISSILVLGGIFGNRNAVPRPLRALFNTPNVSFELFLIFAGVLKALFWLAVTDFSNPIFFLIRRLDSALGLVPLFVGLTALKLKRALAVWVFVFAFQLLVAIFTGTRGQAFIPLLLFFIGLLIAQPTLKSRMQLGASALLPAGSFLLIIGVYIGVARDVVGRTDLAKALESGTLVDRISRDQFDDALRRTGNVMFEASSRLSSWPPLVVPTLCPEKVPYRGFSDLPLELAATTNIRIGSDITSGAMYFPNIHLKPFGFAVNVRNDGVQTSSVELSSFVDGYTRGGWISGFTYCMFAYLILWSVETLCRRVFLDTNTPLFQILLVVICNPLRYADNGMVGSIRLLLLETVMCAVIFYIFCLFFESPTFSRAQHVRQKSI